LIILGDAIQQGLTQDDYSVTGAVIVVVTLMLLQMGTSYLSFRSPRARVVSKAIRSCSSRTGPSSRET
jgi:uncharacterized membrane protein YcaP (DUF421 family)